MSLIGNLEELGLEEILQLISLSRKTGVLSLRSRGREGTIVFRQGLVVRALSSSFRMGLGDVLIRKGIIGKDTLRKALALQQERGSSELLGEILTKRFAVAPETMEVAVREQIEQIVLSLFAWCEGTFDFEAQGESDALGSCIADPLQFVLPKGLNPQLLVLAAGQAAGESNPASETSQVLDGSGEPDEEELVFHVSDEFTDLSGTPEKTASRPLVIVDDDGTTLQALSGMLRGHGYEVHAMTSSEDTLILVDGLCRTGRFPSLLVDLIMPRMDGSGVLGGIELLQLLHNNFKDIPILVMTDYHHADAEKKVGDMGYNCIMKPHRADCLSSEKLQSFLPTLLAELRRLEAEAAV